MKTSTPIREQRGIKRRNSMSPGKNLPSGSKSVQSGSVVEKSLRFDKGDTVHEGERDTVPLGEFDTCEFWENQDSLNSESSHGGDIQSGASGVVLPAREEEKCGVCNLEKVKDVWTVGLCKGEGYCGDN